MQHAVSIRPQRGHTALRVLLFDTPQREVASALTPPWPRWMRRMYDLEEASNEKIAAEQGETTASAAVSALATRLKHRLDVIAFAVGVLEGLQWEVELIDDALIASARMTPYQARHVLEDAGVAGPLSAVCELDDAGWPRMWYGGDG